MKKKPSIFPKYQKVFIQLGENIKLARKRRRLTLIQVAERAGINRSTLSLLENGSSGVSLGVCFNVLKVLGLQNDFLKIASDDVLGKTLQDIELLGGR